MSGYESHESRRDEYDQLPEIRQRAKERERQIEFDVARDLLPYQIVLGGKPIRLEQPEYRFLVFLASRPYHAFSTREVLHALNNQRGEESPLTESTLRELVRSLRDKLGFFWDFVQVVPKIGYRFRP